jgi:YbgC/YbaW family acyl-CoA thioester hydrolase
MNPQPQSPRLPADTPPSLSPSDFRLLMPWRVRWSEIDAQQVVFNGHYLSYFDTALSAWWRALALPYAQTMGPLGLDVFMRACQLDYRAPARLDDTLQVGLRLAGAGRTSLRFQGAVFRQGQNLVQAEFTHVVADARLRQSREVPEPLLQVMRGFEAGQAMSALQCGGWGELGEMAGAVRQQVFVQEQGIPAELEWDALDAQAEHAVLTNRLGLAVATGRLLWSGMGPLGAGLGLQEGEGKIGRMAVLHALRGGALGRAVLHGLMARAGQLGLQSVCLHAQLSAEGFYAREGFERWGEPFVEVHVPHVKMRRLLG